MCILQYKFRCIFSCKQKIHRIPLLSTLRVLGPTISTSLPWILVHPFSGVRPPVIQSCRNWRPSQPCSFRHGQFLILYTGSRCLHYLKTMYTTIDSRSMTWRDRMSSYGSSRRSCSMEHIDNTQPPTGDVTFGGRCLETIVKSAPNPVPASNPSRLLRTAATCFGLQLRLPPRRSHAASIATSA